jgi:hypothetical protein
MKWNQRFSVESQVVQVGRPAGVWEKTTTGLARRPDRGRNERADPGDTGTRPGAC